MRILIWILILSFAVAAPVSALEITAPAVPDSGQDMMPRAETFGEGLWELLRHGARQLWPEFAQASRVCLGITAIVLLLSVLQSFQSSIKITTELAGAVAIAALLLGGSESLIHLGTQTIEEMTSYGKLLMPVLTSAMAAQGCLTSSAALFAGTSIFSAFLSALIQGILVPMVYLFLAMATANGALGEDLLKKARDFIKWSMTWCLKIILYVFTGFMGITGVISGSTDAAVLKATKITISSAVPVVGGILADASEAVLVSAGVVKNTAGVYGIFALLAVFLGPFLKIGSHYLMLKLTAAICGVFGPKRISDLTGDFSAAMGLVLAMTGSVCLMLLISAVCFMKGVG